MHLSTQADEANLASGLRAGGGCMSQFFQQMFLPALQEAHGHAAEQPWLAGIKCIGNI
jgi:hypothetical protein